MRKEGADKGAEEKILLCPPHLPHFPTQNSALAQRPASANKTQHCLPA